MAKDNSTSGDKLISFFDDEQNYRRIRKVLIIYFSRELYSTAQDHEDCADETILRVIKKIDEGIEITNEIETDGIEKYIFGVARFVKMEFWRRPKIDSIEDDSTFTVEAADDTLQTLVKTWEQEEILSCYQKCISEFSDPERTLFDGYYIPPPGEKFKDVREKLSVLLGLSRPILKKRAFRLRERLEVCMKKCLGSDGTESKKSHK